MNEKKKLLPNWPTCPSFLLKNEKPYWKNLISWWDRALTRLFPNTCLGCNACSDDVICTNCLAQIHWVNSKIDFKFEVHTLTLNVLTDYSGIIRQALHDMKFNGRMTTCTALGVHLSSHERWEWITAYDHIIPVPIHPKRLKMRGFNHVEALFSSVLQTQDRQWSRCIERTKNTIPLFELTKQDRLSIMQNAFQLRPEIRLQNTSCLIVDDLVTTGTTVNEMATLLYAAGAKKVEGLVLAHQTH